MEQGGFAPMLVCAFCLWFHPSSTFNFYGMPGLCDFVDSHSSVLLVSIRGFPILIVSWLHHNFSDFWSSFIIFLIIVFFLQQLSHCPVKYNRSILSWFKQPLGRTYQWSLCKCGITVQAICDFSYWRGMVFLGILQLFQMLLFWLLWSAVCYFWHFLLYWWGAALLHWIWL